jgi:predicted 3-demethylubiquinone-9 3-methyltransferase (glyoxalase superfamily)
MQKITPFLWFDHQVEEAARLYTSLLPNSAITGISRYTEGSHGQIGSVMTVSFTLQGQEFTALNGGPEFSFTPAISFVINCETQAEVDHIWDTLAEDGHIEQCGWLRDKFGVSWQIVPTILGELMQDPDPEKTRRVMEAMLKMIKLDIEGLKRAYNGE